MPEKTITVELGDRSYPVYVGNGLLRSLPRLLNDHSVSGPIVVVCDRNVARLHYPAVERLLTSSGYSVVPVILPPGERYKNLGTAGRIYTRMLRAGIGRSATVLAVGGGVIGDLAGFVAATYQRGLTLVHCPTTLLAQVDSSIGGKTGVNHALGKNMIGAFYQPRCVIADNNMLRTLPHREVVCGLGEIVKYGIILDEELFSWIESGLKNLLDLDPPTLFRIVSRCVELKSQLVSRDEREAGERVVLNCGHTIGHALEAEGGYRLLKHGEAVLLGLAAESHLAVRLNLLSQDSFERITSLIGRVPLKVGLRRINKKKALSFIGRDKKGRLGRNRFVLPVRIGQTSVVEDIPREMVGEALDVALALARSGSGRAKKL